MLNTSNPCHHRPVLHQVSALHQIEERRIRHPTRSRQTRCTRQPRATRRGQGNSPSRWLPVYVEAIGPCTSFEPRTASHLGAAPFRRHQFLSVGGVNRKAPHGTSLRSARLPRARAGEAWRIDGTSPLAYFSAWLRASSCRSWNAQYSSKSPLERSALSLSTASAPSSPQRAPVRSMRSFTRWRHAPSMTPVEIGRPMARYM